MELNIQQLVHNHAQWISRYVSHFVGYVKRGPVQFAQRCGVSASLRALRTQGMDAVRLVTHTDPADQLAALAHYCSVHADCNVVGIHLFTFGGVTSAAQWMNRYIAARD